MRPYSLNEEKRDTYGETRTSHPIAKRRLLLWLGSLSTRRGACLPDSYLHAPVPRAVGTCDRLCKKPSRAECLKSHNGSHGERRANDPHRRPNVRTFVLLAKLSSYEDPNQSNVLGTLNLRLTQAIGNPNEFNATGLAELKQRNMLEVP
jgi:hypothetical protein